MTITPKPSWLQLKGVTGVSGPSRRSRLKRQEWCELMIMTMTNGWGLQQRPTSPITKIQYTKNKKWTMKHCNGGLVRLSQRASFSSARRETQPRGSCVVARGFSCIRQNLRTTSTQKWISTTKIGLISTNTGEINTSLYIILQVIRAHCVVSSSGRWANDHCGQPITVIAGWARAMAMARPVPTPLR